MSRVLAGMANFRSVPAKGLCGAWRVGQYWRLSRQAGGTSTLFRLLNVAAAVLLVADQPSSRVTGQVCQGQDRCTRRPRVHLWAQLSVAQGPYQRLRPPQVRSLLRVWRHTLPALCDRLPGKELATCGLCPALIAHPALTLQRHYTKLVAGSTPYQRLWAAEDTALPEDFGEHRGGAPVMQ